MLLLLALRSGLALCGYRLAFFLFTLRQLFFVLFNALVVEVHLDAVIEMRFLQQLAKVARTNLCLQSFFFILVEVVFFKSMMAMHRRLELLALDHFFFYEPAAGRELRASRERLNQRVPVI